MGLQIKYLLELNCVCPVPLNFARAFVALGSRVMEGAKIRMPSRGFYNGPDANSCGRGTKRERISCGALFYNVRHVARSAWCWSVKQDHQFLTKIFTQHQDSQLKNLGEISNYCNGRSPNIFWYSDYSFNSMHQLLEMWRGMPLREEK